MHMAVFGATGRAGRVLTARALELGHQVSALVRDPARLGDLTHERLHLVVGDVRDAKATTEAIANTDAVVSMLGATRTAPHTCAEGIGTILPAMTALGVKPLIVLSNYGIAESRHRSPYVAVSWLLERSVLLDKERMEELIKASSTQWTVIRAPILTNGPRTDAYRTGTDLRLTFTSRVSRADLAEFTLTELSANDFTHRAVAITL